MSVLVRPFSFCEPPRDTCNSGTALIFTRRGATWCSHSRSVPLFLGAGCVCLGWKRPRVFESRAAPVAVGTPWFLLCGAVVFLAAAAGEFEYLWACLAKATFIIIRLMCTPERQSQNHPESSCWKQRWGPFSRRGSYISFYFWMVSRLSTQTRGRLYCLCSGETLVEKEPCWCRGVWVRERGSERRRRGGLGQLGLQPLYRAPGANLDSFARFIAF